MTLSQVDEPRLETDTAYRFRYLRDFIGFGNDDVDAIHAAAVFLGPRVPGLVDAVYDKLFAYDATKRHLVPRQSGYEGPLPEGIDGVTGIFGPEQGDTRPVMDFGIVRNTLYLLTQDPGGRMRAH